MKLDLVEVYSGYIQMGKPLVLPLYSSEGLLLANKGSVLDDEQFAIVAGHEKILTPKSELIAELEAIKLSNYHAEEIQDAPYQFPDTFSRLMKLERQYIKLLSHKGNDFEKKMMFLVRQLDALITSSPDSSLAKIFLRTTRYASIELCFATAIIGAICTRAMEWDETERHLFMCAAMTLDVGILLKTNAGGILNLEPSFSDIQDDNNVYKSAAFLIEQNIDNAKWLNYVLNHRLNDPRGNSEHDEAADLSMSNSLMIFIHNYCQMVLGYGYEQRVFPNVALTELVRENVCRYRKLFLKVFSRAVGIFPAGGMLNLVTGEICLVQKQSADSSKPFVRILQDKHGKLVSSPLVRQLDNNNLKIRDMIFNESLMNKVDFSAFWR